MAVFIVYHGVGDRHNSLVSGFVVQKRTVTVFGGLGMGVG